MGNTSSASALSIFPLYLTGQVYEFLMQTESGTYTD